MINSGDGLMAKCENCENDFEELIDGQLCEECSLEAGADRMESYNDLD